MYSKNIKQETLNIISSELSVILSENEISRNNEQSLSNEHLFYFFTKICKAFNLDSRDIVNILETFTNNKDAKEEILRIKITEGW